MFVLIFNQLVKMLFILLLAIFCFRKGLINQEGNKNFSNLLLSVVNPCLIITVYQTDNNPERIKKLITAFAFALLAHFVAILIAKILIREKGNDNFSLERLGAVYSNCGFIGIPLISSVLGSEGVFYLSAYITVFNILTWTHGLTLLKGNFEWKYIKQGLMSPMMIATFFAIFLYFFRIRLPEVILDSLNYVADMNTPLAMFVAGCSVAQADIKNMFRDFRIYWICFIKLIVFPLTVLVVLWLLKADYSIAYTTLIATACPTATTVTMMSIRYGRDYRYASKLFSFSTVLSIITIPIVVFFAGFLL